MILRCLATISNYMLGVNLSINLIACMCWVPVQKFKSSVWVMKVNLGWIWVGMALGM